MTPKDVKTEHRAALLTFAQWDLMYIVEEGNIGNTQQSVDNETDVSFSSRLFNATMDILKLDNQRRREQHYSVPSAIHIPSAPSSPTHGAAVTLSLIHI